MLPWNRTTHLLYVTSKLHVPQSCQTIMRLVKNATIKSIGIANTVLDIIYRSDGPKLSTYEKCCVVQDSVLNIFIYLEKKKFLLQFLIIVKCLRSSLIRESCVCYILIGSYKISAAIVKLSM